MNWEIFLLVIILIAILLLGIWYITLRIARSVISYIQTQGVNREKEAERNNRLILALAKKDPVIVDPVPVIEKLGEMIARLQGSTGVAGDSAESYEAAMAAMSGRVGGVGEEETIKPGFENDPWLTQWNLDKINENTITPTLENSVGPPLPTEQEQ